MNAARLPERVETDRLVIRLWRADDVAAMHEAITSSLEHLRPWLPWAAHEPLEPTERLELLASMYRDWENGGDAVYGIFLETPDADNGGVVVGGTGLHRRIGPGGLEIGYWIHVDQIRNGYATEAAAALTAVGLRQPGIDRIEIHHDRANKASAGVPPALGFMFVGEAPREIATPAESGVTWIWRKQ